MTDELVRCLLDPDATRQLAKQFERMRQATLDRLREQGCPAELLKEAETACLKHQRAINLVLASHAERLEAHLEYQPHVFEILRRQFGIGQL